MSKKHKNWVKPIVSSRLSNSNNFETGAHQLCSETIAEADNHKQLEEIHVKNWDLIKNKLHEVVATANYSNITIDSSTDVHLGNVINYDGDLTLNLVKESNEPNISLKQNNDSVEFLINKVSNIYISACHIIPRSTWSIKQPKEKYDQIEEPVKLVIISHTATTSSVCPAKNIEVIRDIQAFHVDTQRWNDVAYNFLIGCDGNIYEGRGWGHEGAHTFGYNNRSIGISFIGCFITKMPTEQALNACQNLLQGGVKEGHLSKDYKLLGHRQCTSTESPGTKLFDDITKWDHFYNKSIDELSNDII